MTLLGHLSMFLLIFIIALSYFIMFLITEDYESIFRSMIKNRVDYEPLKFKDIWTTLIISIPIFVFTEGIYWIMILLINSIN